MKVRGTCIAVFGILLASYAYVYGGLGSNQNARFDLLTAIVKDGSLIIDEYHKNTGDKAEYDGHFYTSKPPGTAFLALPTFYGAYKYLEWIDKVPRNLTSSRFVTWSASVGSVAVLASIGGAATFLGLRRLVKDRIAFLAVMFAFLGTPLFPYATVLFSHAGTAGLIAVALACAVVPKKRVPAWAAVLCGLAAGFAVAGELVSGIAAAGAVAYLIYRDWRRAPYVLAGLVPGAAVMMGYNWLAFGTPFTIGYAHEYAYPNMVRTGVLGIDVTTYVDRLPQLLFDPNKGLFFWGPFLLLGIGGVEKLYRKHRSVFWLVAGVVVLHLLLVTSHRSSLGGTAISARNYISLIPYLAIPAALGLARAPRLGSAVGVLSVALSILVAIVGVQVNQRMQWPLFDHYLVKFAQGMIRPTLLSSLMGRTLPPEIALAPLVAWIGVTVPLTWAFLGDKTPKPFRKLAKWLAS